MDASPHHYRHLLDRVDLMAVCLDLDGRITYCNDSFLRTTGWTRSELLGADWFVTVLPAMPASRLTAMREVLRNGRAPRWREETLRTRDGRRVLVRWSTLVLRRDDGTIEGLAGIGQDITTERAAQQQLEDVTGLYEALFRTNRAIVRGGDLPTLCNEVCATCVDAGHSLLASVWLIGAGGLSLTAAAGPVLAMFGEDRPVWNHRDPGFAGSMTGQALATGLPQYSNDYQRDPRSADWHGRAAECGVRGAAALPLHCGGQVAGVLMLHVGAVNWFDERLCRLLEEMSADLSFALDNFEREAARQLAERAAAAGHERFRRIFHGSPLMTAVRSLSRGELLDANQAYVRLNGLQGRVVIGRTPEELGIVFDRVEVDSFQALMRAQNGHVSNFDMAVRTADGRRMDMLVHAEMIDFGGQQAVLTISHDITERKRIQKQLEGIVETAMDAIITVDAQQRIQVFNGAAAEMFGVSALQALGSPLERFIPAQQRLAHQAHVRAFSASGAGSQRMSRRADILALRADGAVFPVEVSLSRQGEGRDLLVTAVVRDVSLLREAESAREAQVLAEAASQAKTEFLSHMSHELRTPLNAMLGFSQLLESDPREPLSPRQRQHLELSRQAGWHLLGLIDDVLDVASIEAGRLNLELQAVSLREVLDAALVVSEPLARTYEVRHVPVYRESPDLLVQADPNRLRQVMINLLSNGTKYNRPGGSVRIETVASPEGVEILVIDDGLGMNPDQQTQLFQPFNRLGRERSAVQGTGIGLSLSRQLLEHMGGRIELDSLVGQGTRVRVGLPRARAASATDGAASEATPPALVAGTNTDARPQGEVLYIEDNPVNLMLVQEFFRRWPGVTLRSASLGAEGLALARSDPPDLVLLDMQLPDMTGLQVLAQLQAEPATAAVPVVALSASAMPDEIALARRAGARDYWTKPLHFERFASELMPYLRRAGGGA